MKPILLLTSIALLCLFAACSDSDSDDGTKPATMPAVPTGLSVTDAGFMNIALSWNASDDADEYLLYRSETISSNYTQVHTGPLTEHNDTGLPYGATYYYRVSAANSAGECERTAAVSGVTTTPDGFTVTGSEGGSMDYTFNYLDDFNGKPRYQTNPIGFNLLVPSSGDQAGLWVIYDQIEGMSLYYHPTVGDYPRATGWRRVFGDTASAMVVAPFRMP